MLVDRPLAVQVLVAARSQLCPRPVEVVSAYTEVIARKKHRPKDDPRMERLGMEKTVSRYSETDFMNKDVILDALRRNNPLLHNKILEPVKRIEGEMPDKSLDRRFLPPDFDQVMRYGSTPYGFCLPRNCIVYAGETRGDGEERGKRLLKTIDIVERVSKGGDTEPIVFMAKLARELVKEGADARRIIYHSLSLDILGEQGCKTMFNQTLRAFRIHARGIWNEYRQMIKEHGVEGMHKMGILVPEDLK